MKRRSFVKASVLTGAFGSIIPAISKAASAYKKQSGEFYEIRTYTLKNARQQKLVEDHYQYAAIPALNRLGSNNVGVFTELKPLGQTKLYVIIPFNSLDDFLKVHDKLALDTSYQEKAAAYLSPGTEPAYERIESSLQKAFALMPKLAAPEKKQRIFELRRYESPGETTGKKKIEMFNEGGEIEIFKRLGFKPVFFSETLIGVVRPNLIYMITFDDMDAHDKIWKAFMDDPEWKKLSGMPEYSKPLIVSHITSTILNPAVYSQI